MAEPLDALTLPLHGSRLIEASAGTGKTWTIAALVLRLVLGHGRPALQPGEILVMTFTKAATRELSDRIRDRLVEAAAAFRSETSAKDDFLVSLMDAHPAGPARQQAAWRLAMAAEAMDDAAVFTIDAWCQRMLREHAFDSGCLFDEELQANEAVVLAEALRDYWRQQVYPLPGGVVLDAVLARWPDVAALTRDVQPLLDKPLPAEAGHGSLADVARRNAAAMQALKAGWAERADEMQAWLENGWAHLPAKALPTRTNATRWLDMLRAWAQDPAIDTLDLQKGAERLSRTGLRQSLAAAGVPDEVPDCFAQFEDLVAELARLPEPGLALRMHAAVRVVERMQQLKAQAGRFGFADMLNRLDAALDEARHGPKAQRLRERILAQYPVALIDEFQDTSPVQLRIFDRLYRIADNDPSRALLLIGDPKQAIYGFRGADIHSYLVARRDTTGRHHALGTNHRSTTTLVAAVNALFQAAESREGEGAFMFRDAAGTSALPFVPVGARGRGERLVDSAGEVAALQLVVDGPPRRKDDALQLFAALCAERIVGLLNDPQAGFETDGKPLRRLRPADIAVLVHNRTEAEAVRHEMRCRGLASVYLSDRDSIFLTPEAADVLRLLQAVAAPRNVRLARAALATRLMGRTLPELVALASDDALFDQHAEQLQALAQAWQGQGVLAMLRRALHAFDLPARWLAADAAAQGERRLTNVLHLAELLQAASAQAEGEQAQVRWLAQQVAEARAGMEGDDELILRLESDADLVKVVTVHMSKGLEYPVVFLPFAAHFREAVNAQGRRNAVLLLPGAAGERELVVAPDEAQLAQAEHERQREALRLLYVALTRARHALWVGLAGVQAGKALTWHRSAIGHLLSGPGEAPNEQRVRDAQVFAHGQPGVQATLLPDTGDGLPLPPITPLHARGALPKLAPSPDYSAQFERNWSIASYSTLVRDAAWTSTASGTVPQPVRDDEPVEPTPATAPRAAADQPWHRFPRGALAGNFLHDQLEWLAGEDFALDESPALQAALARRCERQGWGHRSDDVVAWLRYACATPLPALAAPLAALQTCAAEMEFWLPSDGLHARQVDELCRRHLQPGAPRPQLPERALKGMLMGFADLVFEHGGRYWVLDYKSNSLGPRDADYTHEAMDAAMLEHRYDVQAALYLLALHRLLKARLGGGYVPARHLGGAVYFFLRGVNSATAGCCHVAAPLGLLDELDALLRQASPEAA